MMQRHSETRRLGALGLTSALVGLVSQGTTGALVVAKTQQRADQGGYSTPSMDMGLLIQQDQGESEGGASEVCPN